MNCFLSEVRECLFFLGEKYRMFYCNFFLVDDTKECPFLHPKTSRKLLNNGKSWFKHPKMSPHSLKTKNIPIYIKNLLKDFIGKISILRNQYCFQQRWSLTITYYFSIKAFLILHFNDFSNKKCLLCMAKYKTMQKFSFRYD